MRRRNRYPRRDAGTGFAVFIIVIILAVAAGYAGTKYIIFPHLLGTTPSEDSGINNGGDKTTTETAVDVITSPPSVIIDQQNLKNDSTNNGNNSAVSGAGGPFSVQFGSFSTKEGADAMSAELTGKGIYSYVYESGGSYKVLGLPYATEEKAKEAASIVSATVSDVFVVNLSNIIQ
jgi:septal ring-binding cell division protein DamX